MSRARFLAALPLLAISLAPIEATPLRKVYELDGQGLSIAQAGVGLKTAAGQTRRLSLDIGGPVELALLYWAGRDHPCNQEPPDSGQCALPAEGLYKDQVLRFEGVPIVGTVLGTEAQPDTNAGPVLNVGYFADVTNAVRSKGTGRVTFAVADGDTASNLADLDGAGLLVIYEDPEEDALSRVIVFHGLDFAYGEDRTHGPSEITEPLTFNHGAGRVRRTGQLVLFAGDAVNVGPDRIEVRNNPPLLNRLDASAGPEWDADRFPVEVPGGAGATTVQIFSEPVRQNPDSLLWVMAALQLPLPVSTGCQDTFWAGHLSLWAVAGTPPVTPLRDLFTESRAFPALGSTRAREAIRFRQGQDLEGAARALLRAGVAALLNAGHPDLDYPRTRTQVITAVDTALRSNDIAAFVSLAHELEAANAAVCPLR